MIDNLLKEFEKCSVIESIAIGGSRATGKYDEKSDYDIYIYLTGDLEEERRKKILEKYCDRIEIGNHYWEYEDNCILKNGIGLDLIYRKLDDFLPMVNKVVFQYQAQNGYTTCMWHNLIYSKIVFDRNLRLEKAQKEYLVEYPLQLKENILKRNLNLLRYALPAYEEQIAKAVMRKDLVSINHRVTEFMASYFDVIFALNQMTHPGEKRLIEICKMQCEILPEHFEENIKQLFGDMFLHSERIKFDLNQILEELEKIL